MPRPTFEALAAREPRLLGLLTTARQLELDDWPAFSQTVKLPMLALVGWKAHGAPAELRTSEAYEVALTALADAMGTATAQQLRAA